MRSRFTTMLATGGGLVTAVVIATLAIVRVGGHQNSPPGGAPGATTAVSVAGEQVIRGTGRSDQAEPEANPGGDENRRGADQDASFAITGRVAGFYPGASIPLVLTLTNPNGFAISVTSLEVAVLAAGKGCGPENIVLGPFRGPVVVPGKGTATTQIPMQMVESPADACQGATFPLDYRGTALRA